MGPVVLLLLSGCASSRRPAVTEDGLTRVPGTRLEAVYARPGTDLGHLRSFALEPCTVSFRANWMRDQNLKRDPGRQVKPEDMRRIQDELATLCDEVLAAGFSAIAAAPPASGAAVVTVRPAIVELDLAAPELMTAGRDESYTNSAGHMTLVVELADDATGETLGRVIDYRRAASSGELRRATGLSNRIEAERILRFWVTELVAILRPGEP